MKLAIEDTLDTLPAAYDRLALREESVQRCLSMCTRVSYLEDSKSKVPFPFP